MSYLELAKRSRVRIRSSEGPEAMAATVAALAATVAALAGGRRLTFGEIVATSGLTSGATRQLLGQLLERGEVCTAIDLHRRTEVFWRRAR